MDIQINDFLNHIHANDLQGGRNGMKFSEVSTIRILIYFLGKCNVSHFEYKLYGKWHYQIEHYFNDYKKLNRPVLTVF